MRSKQMEHNNLVTAAEEAISLNKSVAYTHVLLFVFTFKFKRNQ